MRGLEGDRAERSEVKTSQCDVFRERADELIALNTPQQARQVLYKNKTYLISSKKTTRKGGFF